MTTRLRCKPFWGGRLTAALLMSALGVATAQASSEDGGSGLFRVDQAYSLPIGRPLFGVYGGYYSGDTGPASSHLFSLFPSVTWGLGTGFEGSAALLLEGLTADLDSTDYERRIDLRKRDLSAKIRWTGPLGGTDARIGVEGLLGVPFGSSTRAGGDRSPSVKFDAGLLGLFSTNLGGLRYPLRVHANLGYWWSRDDGAYYFRQHPDALPIPSDSELSNDALVAGLGMEVGFSRLVALAELSTEQLTAARSQLTSSENLWRLTVGMRTALSPSIGMTAGISFDLSSDDPETELDPDDIYPGHQFRLGFTFGGVMSREAYEARRAEKRREDESRTLAAAASAADEAEAPARTAFVSAELEPHAATPAESRSVAQLEARIQQLETTTRLGLLETRLQLLERGLYVAPPMTGMVSPGDPAALGMYAGHADSTVTPGATNATGGSALTPRELALTAQLAALQRQVLMLQQSMGSSSGPTAASPDPTASPVPTAAASGAAPQTSFAVPVPTTTQPEHHTKTDLAKNALAAGAGALVGGALAGGGSSPQPVQVTIIEPGVGAPVTSTTPNASATPEAAPATGSAPATPAPTQQMTTPAVGLVANETTRSPATPAAQPAPVQPADASAPVFPVAVGARTTLDGIDLDSPSPLASEESRLALDSLASLLMGQSDVRILLLVHGEDGDRDGALKLTEQQASSLRDYLVVAGADPEQVTPLGLGVSEGTDARVEIERIQ